MTKTLNEIPDQVMVMLDANIVILLRSCIVSEYSIWQRMIRILSVYRGLRYDDQSNDWDKKC